MSNPRVLPAALQKITWIGKKMKKKKKEENEVSRAVQPMKTIIKLLQKELGETVPPVTSHFFIWLCYFFPDESNLNEAHRLNFKMPSRTCNPL